jgi:hypothetical protein
LRIAISMFAPVVEGPTSSKGHRYRLPRAGKLLE